MRDQGYKRGYKNEADRKADLLRHVCDLSQENACPMVSKRNLAAALGLSEHRVWEIARIAEREGLLAVKAQYLPNGGQAENSYEVTDAGRKWLEGRCAPKVV